MTQPPGRHYAEELIDRMTDYGLDSSDTLMLMEARRLGIDGIVSMDTDMQRALADFDVYTWF